MRQHRKRQGEATPQVLNASGPGPQPSHASERQLQEHEQLPNAQPVRVRHSGRLLARGATGPRTTEGKQRSRLNALKHGILSKNFLAKHESREEYDLLLRGLKEDFWPQGTLETELVENLAITLWRKRRLLEAESAEIANVSEFLKLDSGCAQHSQAWDHARLAESSSGMLKHVDNPFVVQIALDILKKIRDVINTQGLEQAAKDHWLSRKLFGLDEDGTVPYGTFNSYLALLQLASETKEDKTANELKESAVRLFDSEIRHLETLRKLLEPINNQRIEYKRTAALVPSREASERLVRYEAHLSREFDRTLSQLERLQRMRRGQPVAPRIDVNIST